MTNFTSMFKVACLLLCIGFSQSTFSQNDHEASCGTIVTPEDLNYYNSIKDQLNFYEEEYFQKLQNRSSTAISSIPIKAHVIRTSAGTGGLTEGQLNAAIANMNNFYANAFMEFYLCDGINYINSDTFYDYETNEEGALTGANNVANLINIYFTETVTSSSSGGGLCGYAYLPGGPDVILMANNCTTNGSTLIHEVGHFFGLLHTHGPSNSNLTTELVDGSNCDTDGDFLCDTPADPQLGYSNVNTSCIYTGFTQDANGDTFVPDPTNIMSYSRKECRTYLSPQQYARIYGAYQTARNYFACPSFNVDAVANYTRDCSDELVVDFVDNSPGATSWQWDVDGDDVIDYTTQNPTHTFGPGTYDVALTVSNGTNTLTKVYANLIDFETLIVNTTEIDLELMTDNWCEETTWNFKDSEGNILYSGGPYQQNLEDNTLFNYTFEVNLGECYSFEIFDSYGDGICCSQGNGYYQLTLDDDTVIASGGAIGFGETTYTSNETLSLNDFNKGSVSIYPNPTTDVLNISLNNSSNLPDTIQVYNMLGQLVIDKAISTTADLTLDVSKIENGMYFVKVQKDSKALSIPIVKK